MLPSGNILSSGTVQIRLALQNKDLYVYLISDIPFYPDQGRREKTYEFTGNVPSGGTTTI
ncbi:hypothetical protein ccbrp13_68370 [Ktedonobacteria bacterium brp13]|nr:hypothetical protein ccbrp13_68370 [Ktedonobacteria bacterium brp13]